MRLNVSASKEMAKRRFGVYEPIVSEFLDQSLSEGDTYVDIGSNKGYHVLDAAEMIGQSGKVYAFEPNHDNFVDLQYNLNLNGIDNVELRNEAVCDHDGELFLQRGEASGHGKISMTGGDLRVDAVRFDSFLAEAGVDDVDVIKIDVEGAEKDVIRGMSNFLSDGHDCQMIVEIHPDNVDIQSLTGLLSDLSVQFDIHEHGYWSIST
jgi:FkbM family methyltransferase